MDTYEKYHGFGRNNTHMLWLVKMSYTGLLKLVLVEVRKENGNIHYIRKNAGIIVIRKWSDFKQPIPFEVYESDCTKKRMKICTSK